MEPDFSKLIVTWTEPYPIPSQQLFYPNKTPKVFFLLEFWKKLIDDYFRHYAIPRHKYGQVWTDIVECIISIPNDPDYFGNAEFYAWAFGCMCRFVIEDKKRAEKRMK